MSKTSQSLREIFNEALEIADVEQRREYLAKACGANTDLRQSIENLIAANDAAGKFLDGAGATESAWHMTNASEEHVPPSRKQSFSSTHWSVVLAAGDSESPHANAALEQLCRAYWYPLYAYVRRRGHGEHDAQDLTQGFFAQLLHRHAFRGLVPGRARFRSFLLVALNHFLSDEHARQRAQKRGGGQATISFDAHEAEDRYQLEPAHSDTPERLFERRWAVAVLNGALERLEQEFSAAGKSSLFEQLRSCLLEGTADRSYADTARLIGMAEEAVKKAAQRMRRRYREAIREQIGQTVVTASEIEEELRYLCAVLRT